MIYIFQVIAQSSISFQFSKIQNNYLYALWSKVVYMTAMIRGIACKNDIFSFNLF